MRKKTPKTQDAPMKVTTQGQTLTIKLSPTPKIIQYVLCPCISKSPIKQLNATERTAYLRPFLKRQLLVQMAKIHMKKSSPFLAIKEMQIKTTLRFHLSC
jgi:hypothetical protein